MKAKKRPNNILQHGEVTGHYHEATGQGVAVMEEGIEVWMLAPNGAIITHQEHGPIPVQPRIDGYDRLIVREYDHFTEEARQVVD